MRIVSKSFLKTAASDQDYRIPQVSYTEDVSPGIYHRKLGRIPEGPL